MNVTVRLFAMACDLAGRVSVELQLAPGATVADARIALATECPELTVLLGHCLLAVGEEYAGDNEPLKNGAALACIPPVSGG